MRACVRACAYYCIVLLVDSVLQQGEVVMAKHTFHSGLSPCSPCLC